jgi:hypothetical protein
MKRCIVFVCCVLAVLIHYPNVTKSAPDEDNIITAKKAKKTASAVVKDDDSDNDGVPDNEDDCPSIPGSAATRGCPDTDGDGIADHLDDCPTLSGLVQFRGCPDTDGDGIPDNKDVCPHDAGPASNNGCPLPEKGNKAVTTAKVIDTVNFEMEMDLQLMHYEKYLAELESTHDEYIQSQSNRSASTARKELSYNEGTGREKIDKPVKNDKTQPGKDVRPESETTPKEEKRPNIAENTSPAVTGPTVTINSPQFQSFKPKLEVLMADLKFQNGRVLFVDEYKFFSALHELATYCTAYPEWTKIIFNCYSNETDNAYGNKQLFSNRVHTMKKMLAGNLNVSSSRLEFVNKVGAPSSMSNYIALEIKIKE